MYRRLYAPLLFATAVLLSLAFPSPGGWPDHTDTYGHAPAPSFSGRPVRIDDEQFSDNMASTRGDAVRITGSVRNVSEQEFKMSPYVFVTPGQFVDSQGIRHGEGASTFYYLMNEIYLPYRDTASLYFAVERDLPNLLVLEPGGSAEYEIRLYPLKAGVYHVHSAFVSDDTGLFLGRGQTVTVTGSTAPTLGEIAHLYLPFAFGLAALVILTLRAIRVLRKRGQKRAFSERVFRAYFAVKSAYETVWLSGALIWMASATYSYMYALEARYLFLLPAAAGLAAITFGGYAAAAARSRVLHLASGTATSAATAAFHSVMSSGFVGDYYAKEELFRISYLFSLTVVIMNIGIAAYLLIKLYRERRRKETDLQPTTR